MESAAMESTAEPEEGAWGKDAEAGHYAAMAQTAGPWMQGAGYDMGSDPGAARQGAGSRVPPLRASASSPGHLNFGSTTSSARMSQRSRKSGSSIPSSPFRLRPPFKYPDFDVKTGVKIKLADHKTDWDERHQLLLDPRGEPMADNDLLPRGVRKYFSEVHTEDGVRSHLTSQMAKSTTNSLKSVLKGLDGEKTPRKVLNPVTADVGPPLLAARHTFGGSMQDVDGMVRPWNNRWHRGISQLNEGCHKSHRQYFVQQSLFKVSPSQEYRRYNHQEVAPGKWIPCDTKKPSGPRPLGV